MKWEEFKSKVLKLSSTRHHKINKSIGVYDLYKLLRKNKWYNIPRPLTEHEFYSIIRTVNNYLANELVNGNAVKFPNKMGILELRKYNARMSFENGKIKTNLPVDWNRTLKLWYEDNDSFNNKTLIRLEEKEIFKVFYNKKKAKYNNKTFYDFSVNRNIKRKLVNKIKEKEIDAYEMGRVTI